MDKKQKESKSGTAAKTISGPSISPARIAAYEVLFKIETNAAYSSVLLPLAEEKLEARDKGLCHELVLGVLRTKLRLDFIIAKFVQKKIDDEIRIILRLGLYQLIFLDRIPQHAAINDSVNLTRLVRKNSAKGFVNAVLRGYLRGPVEMNFDDDLERVSVETSHPKWLLQKWSAQFGRERAASIAAANNASVAVDFRFTAKTTEAVKCSIEGMSPEERPAFLRELSANGKIYFQDRASQMVAGIVDLQPGESFLDVCAAPGSKLTQIATSTERIVIGGDINFQRAVFINESAKRQGLKNVSILQFDSASALPFAADSFDAVLVDAPCSGTGTIRNNPEIRYTLIESDFPVLALRQSAILSNASKCVKPGGRLIYSTCSIETEENELVIEEFLRNDQRFERVDAVADIRFVTGRGFIRMFPDRDAIAGFFVAVLRKIN